MFRQFSLISLFLLSITSYAQGSRSHSENTQVKINKTRPHNQASAADILSSLKQAQEAPSIMLTPVLQGSAELGLLYKSGDTKSGDLKSGLDLRFEAGQWLSLLNIDLLVKKAERPDSSGVSHFQTTDKKWSVRSQTNYSLGHAEKNYVYGNIWYEESEFSSYLNQSSISSGWGRQWYKNDVSSLWADVGPGYKRDLYKSTDSISEKSADAWIIQMQALYLRKLTDHIQFKQFLSAKHAIQSADNSIYKAESTITTKLISTLQLKFTFKVDYNTQVKVGKENLNSQTAVALVYSF